MDYLYLFLSIIILWFTADYLVLGSSNLAKRFGLSELLVGLTIIAWGTSAPELFVSVIAAINQKSEISVANVVGSNITNIALILGLTAALTPIVVTKENLKRDLLGMIIISLLTLPIFLNGNISRGEGIFFIALLILYTILIYKTDTNTSICSNQKEEIKTSIYLDIVYILGGLVGLIIGSKLLVTGASSIASSFGISDTIIGLTVVAIGTSMPEIFTSVVAAIKGKTNLAIGNIIGSNIVNILGILGASSIITPLKIAPEILSRDIWWMIGIAIITLPIAFTGKIVSRGEGIFLLFIYIIYTSILIISV